MKFSRLILCTLAIAGTAAIWAQSSPSPGNTSAQAANAKISSALAAPSPSATAPIEPPSLIPPNILPEPGQLPKIPSAPELEQLSNFFKHSSLGKAAEEHRLHVQMAALETRIRNDADLAAAKAAARQAETDLEKRHLLRAYYELYYKKLRVLAESPELKAYLDAQRAAHQVTLLQPRVRHETDQAAAAALTAAAKAAAKVAPAPTPAQAKPNQGLRP